MAEAPVIPFPEHISILCIDDEKNRKGYFDDALKKAFDEYGIMPSITRVKNIEAAKELLKQRAFSMVFMDIMSIDGDNAATRCENANKFATQIREGIDDINSGNSTAKLFLLAPAELAAKKEIKFDATIDPVAILEEVFPELIKQALPHIARETARLDRVHRPSLRG